MNIGIEFVVVSMALALFGVGYNALTAWMERTGKMTGFTAMMVVGGVFGTLIGAAFVVGLPAALTVGLLFIASGGPMIAGAWARHTQERESEGAALREIVKLIMEQADGFPREQRGRIERYIQEIVDADSRILKEPAPFIAVSELADSSVNFVVRAWTSTDDYWGVYFDMLETVKLTFDEKGISIPYPQMDVHTDTTN